MNLAQADQDLDNLEETLQLFPLEEEDVLMYWDDEQ